MFHNMNGNQRFHARAPILIDFAGSGSDCPPFCGEHEGAVLNAAIRKYVYATLTVRDDNAIHVRAVDTKSELQVSSLDKLEFGHDLDLIIGTIKRLQPEFGFELEIDSGMLKGCGLSASAAMLTATVAVLQRAREDFPDTEEVYRLATQVEREDLALPGGSQDHFAAAYGGINYIRFESLFGQSLDLDLSPEVVYLLEQNLFLIHTGTADLSRNDFYREIQEQCAQPQSPAFEALNGLRDTAKAMARSLQRADLDSFAALMYKNWEFQRRLHPTCANKNIETCRAVLKETGVPGASVCGAGGCIIAYAESETGRQAKLKLLAAGNEIWPVHFDQVGTVTYEA